MRLGLILLLPALLAGQLIPAGQPVPKGANPPVVFIDGYQSGCTSDSSFASNFGAADKLLQNAGLVTLYFDNCTVTGNPDIETVGAAFGSFLAKLKYADGTPVTQVDVVGHSMGGLILRCYLSGKQPGTPATFLPPASVPIRRAVFLGTPHFGSVAAAVLGSDKQTAAMAPGSQFLFDLNTWNQGGDDLRGISALAVAGSGGTGIESGLSGFDDGIVALTSSSLSFFQPGTTRVVPYCHTANSLLSIFGVCKSGVPVLNILSTDPNNMVGQILVSFLTGTNAWKSVGDSAETNPRLSTTAGLQVQLRDQTDLPLPLISGSIDTTPVIKLTANAANIVYAESVPATTSLNVQLTPLSGTVQATTATLAAGTVTVAVVKPGPVISPKGVIPAAGPAPFPYDVAPGAYVSVYGTNLAPATQAASVPYPTQLGGVQVLVDGSPAQIVFVSAGQINFVYPSTSAGLTKLSVKNAAGQNSVNVRVAPAVPSLFLLDAAGTSAAVNASTGIVVGPNSPVHEGDFVSIYLTGLGSTTAKSGLDYANVQPTLTVGGKQVAVSYAGRTPGLAGLDQVNFQVPSGVTGAAVPVVVTSAGRSSSTAFLNVR